MLLKNQKPITRYEEKQSKELTKSRVKIKHKENQWKLNNQPIDTKKTKN